MKIGCSLLCALLFALGDLVHAQKPAKIPTVGVLLPYASGSDARIESFREGLRDLGYIDGQTIRLEYRWADGQFEKLPDLAA